MSPTTPPPAPEPGLLLRLTGPLQSWGQHSHFNERDTAPFPTRSGLIGLLAAALGRRRDEPLDDLAHLSLTVRTDRPGLPMRDLHTVGGGLPTKATVTTAEGKKRSGNTGTLLAHRTYLADAAFTVALTTDDTHKGLLAEWAQALRAPRWPLYLGRRSCPPEGPLLLGESDNALHHLIHLPLAAPTPYSSEHLGRGIEFTGDRPLDRLPVPAELDAAHGPDGNHPSGQINDQPESFAPSRRTYLSRPLYRRTLALPAAQYKGLGLDQLTALADYLGTHLNYPERSQS